jgi:hypothetical protein
LKVYRRKHDDPEGLRQWLNLRKTVADLPRRAELSQAANNRYLEALSTISADTPLSNITDKLFSSESTWGKPLRSPAAMRILVPDDSELIAFFAGDDVGVAIAVEIENLHQVILQAPRAAKCVLSPRTVRLLFQPDNAFPFASGILAREEKVRPPVAVHLGNLDGFGVAEIRRVQPDG